MGVFQNGYLSPMISEGISRSFADFLPFPDVVNILLIAIGLLILVFFLTFIIIFIMSCFKHKISLDDAFALPKDFLRTYYSKYLKYYIAAGIILLYVSVFESVSTFAGLFGNTTLLARLSPIVSLFVYFLPIIIAAVYAGIVDLSVIKSYYNHVRNKKMNYAWISFFQVIKLIILGLIFLILILFSGILLMLPLLIFIVVQSIAIYSIATKDKGIIEGIKEGILILKKGFWDAFFYIVLYSLIQRHPFICRRCCKLFSDFRLSPSFLRYKPIGCHVLHRDLYQARG
ncbi:MAG: hypothetical protein KKF44_08410 [Nanoarchaeota archaeon]|nr:hypothetical protein [Nanoarchaeota archaeon]